MLQPGSSVEFVSFPTITREMLRAYAEASGDFNPIHLDDEVAKKVGLPGIIAHGMLIAGLMAERALQFLRKEPALVGFEVKKFQTRFKAMTFLGDTPSVGGVVKESAQDQFILELTARNQKGEVTTVGTVLFALKTEQ